MGLLGVWDLYAIWIGFRGGELWPFGWNLPGGLWQGLLFTLVGLPLTWMLVWVLVVLGLAAWSVLRRRAE